MDVYKKTVELYQMEGQTVDPELKGQKQRFLHFSLDCHYLFQSICFTFCLFTDHFFSASSCKDCKYQYEAHHLYVLKNSVSSGK